MRLNNYGRKIVLSACRPSISLKSFEWPLDARGVHSCIYNDYHNWDDLYLVSVVLHYKTYQLFWTHDTYESFKKLKIFTDTIESILQTLHENN